MRLFFVFRRKDQILQLHAFLSIPASWGDLANNKPSFVGTQLNQVGYQQHWTMGAKFTFTGNFKFDFKAFYFNWKIVKYWISLQTHWGSFRKPSFVSLAAVILVNQTLANWTSIVNIDQKLRYIFINHCVYERSKWSYSIYEI